MVVTGRTCALDRYVDRDAALTFDGSDFKKLYAMDDVADAQVHFTSLRFTSPHLTSPHFTSLHNFKKLCTQ